MKYINAYLSKLASCDLQSLFSQSRNPLKEISESYGAYKNLSQYIDIREPNSGILCIGDGSLAMTGALFAFLTKGFSVSVDPLLNESKVNKWKTDIGVKNFVTYKKLYQEVSSTIFDEFSTNQYSIACVHAHVNIADVVKKFNNWKYLYTNPCCHRERQTFSLEFQRENNIQVIQYGVDNNILSDKNEIVVYKNNNWRQK